MVGQRRVEMKGIGMTWHSVEKYYKDYYPRYASYPTVPKFSDSISEGDYRSWINSIGCSPTSLYLHIPFYRSTRWHGGGLTSISQGEQPISVYLDVLKREIEMVARACRIRANVRDIQFGGGTLAISKPREFAGLMVLLRHAFHVAPTASVSVEIDPRRMSGERAAMLGTSGVTRTSFSIASFDPKVQKAINQIQSEEETAEAVAQLRANGIKAIQVELNYGLPHQTTRSCEETVAAVLKMRPQQVALLGHTPHSLSSANQRELNMAELPSAEARREQADAIASALGAAGYRRIGLDHFAQPSDELALAADSGQLRRNFQGYTSAVSDNVLGFGAAAIGQLLDGYFQNEVSAVRYARKVLSGVLPIAKGHRMTPDDRLRAHIIQRLMCEFSVDVSDISVFHGFAPNTLLAGNQRLVRMAEDGLVSIARGVVTVNPAYRFMVGAVATAFDAHFGKSAKAACMVA
jgi:oxygen-independent coproporphyrinogen III oxidase